MLRESARKEANNITSSTNVPMQVKCQTGLADKAYLLSYTRHPTTLPLGVSLQPVLPSAPTADTIAPDGASTGVVATGVTPNASDPTVAEDQKTVAPSLPDAVGAHARAVAGEGVGVIDGAGRSDEAIKTNENLLNVFSGALHDGGQDVDSNGEGSSDDASVPASSEARKWVEGGARVTSIADGTVGPAATTVPLKARQLQPSRQEGSCVG